MKAPILRTRTTRGLSLILAAVASLFVLALPAAASNVIPNAIWADGQLFGTVITPTNLPSQGPFDQIYNFAGGGLDGQRSISDAKPGDQDYNGGRWEVHFVTYTPAGISYFDQNHDGKVDFELTSDSQLTMYANMGYLTVDPMVAKRFVCTLNPMR